MICEGVGKGEKAEGEDYEDCEGYFHGLIVTFSKVFVYKNLG